MLDIQGARYRVCDGVSRRDFLRVGALGLSGLALPDLLRLRAQGAPADLVVCDISAPIVIDADQLVSKSKNSPFDGRRLQGRVLRALVEGRTVFEAV